MASIKGFEKEKEKFQAMCLEVAPLLVKLSSILEKNGLQNSAHMTVSKDGFVNFYSSDNDFELTRSAHCCPFRIQFSYSEEISIDGSDKND